MKHLISFIFCTFLFCNLHSQTFAPIGTKWGYNYSSLGGPGSIYLESLGDTILQGRTCRKLSYKDVRYRSSDFPVQMSTTTVYYHERNDSLFSVSQGGAKFNLLFRYNLNVNDTFTNYLKAQYLVTRISDTVISGQTLKKWEVALICKGKVQTGFHKLNFVEKLGALEGFIGWDDFCPPVETTYYEICSFISGNISVGGKCIYSSTQDITEKIKLNIFPNPVHSGLTIESDHVFTAYQISDFTGIIICKGVYNESIKIDVSNFSTGIYLLQLTDNEKQTALKKFFVN